MNPKSGKAGKAETPLEPRKPEEADLAQSGAQARYKALQQNRPGQLESTPVVGRSSSRTARDPSSTGQSTETTEKVWISIELRDTDGNPVANESYEIIVPNETMPRTGRLDGEGKARIDGINPGTCKVRFPALYGEELRKVS